MTPETLPTPKFAIGDVVQLKSGGPLMTIETHNASYNKDCIWYDEGIQKFAFHENCLKLAE